MSDLSSLRIIKILLKYSPEYFFIDRIFSILFNLMYIFSTSKKNNFRKKAKIYQINLSLKTKFVDRLFSFMYDFCQGSQFFKHSLLLMVKNFNILSYRAFKSLAFPFDKIKFKLIQIKKNIRIYDHPCKRACEVIFCLRLFHREKNKFSNF